MEVRAEEVSGQGLGVYIHIPYCASRCPYCDFSSTAVPEAAGVEKRYVECLLRELDAYLSSGPAPASSALQSIYIGGGTPSLFSAESIGRVISAVKAAFSPAVGCEVTIEANPDSIDEAKLEGYLNSGANRLSIGVQSLRDDELKTLGRRHTADKALLSIKSARAAGFANIGADLIFGVPGQPVDAVAGSLAKLIDLSVEHLSVYGLTYEEGTPMSGVRDAGGFAGLLPTEEAEEAMYVLAGKTLAAAGYRHYEISNWARPGFESRHNSRYWLGGEYLGLGVGAHSYMRVAPWGVRWWNDASAARYSAFVRDCKALGARAFTEKLTREEAMVESLMLGLRMLDRGVEAGPFKARYGLSPAEAFPRCTALVSDGLLTLEGEDLLLTRRGVLLSDSVFSELIKPLD